ncbi:MAG: phytoene/squalene synthase family protein [Maricaulaceae bacterium]
MDDVKKFGHASIKKGSKSFALASRVLPPELRDDASMLYAWCRYCDDVIDGQEMGHGQIEDYKTGQSDRLDVLRAQTTAALAGQPTDNPVFAGLARVVTNNAIDHRHPFDLLKGFEMDASDRVYETMDDLLDYSYHVAGVVGVMMANIMGVRDNATLDRASDLGLAFQLTNIARDVMDDAKAGRVFVPREMLRAAGAPIDASGLLAPDNKTAVFKAVHAQLDVAEHYYDSSMVGIKELPFRCAWAISSAMFIYGGIGERLKSIGPTAWDERVSTSKWEKISAVRRSFGFARRRRSIEFTPRDGFYARPL